MKSYKIGIIGAGVIADFHAQAIQAMEGRNLLRLLPERMKSTSLCVQVRLSGLLRSRHFLAHPEMEVVTICSVSGAHLEHATAAANAGKHIICEKPLESHHRTD